MTSFQKANGQAGSRPFERGDGARPRNAAFNTVFSDGIVCLVDGKKKRNLRKWLVLQYGMTPDEYRAMYELPEDYPMSVEEKRSTPIAKNAAPSKPKLIAAPRAA